MFQYLCQNEALHALLRNVYIVIFIAGYRRIDILVLPNQFTSCLVITVGVYGP